MRSFRNISIKKKLTFIIMLTSGSILLITSLSFLVNDIVSLRRAMVENISSISKVIGNNIIAALAFDSRTTAEEILAGLSAEPHIISAHVFKEDGSRFASYINDALKGGSDSDQTDITEVLSVKNMSRLSLNLDDHLKLSQDISDDNSFWDDQIEIVEPVMLDGETIGMLFIEYDLREINSRLRQYAGICSVVFFISLCIGYVISTKLQKVISEPILKLTGAMKNISDRKEYSVRVEKQNDDEIGTLVEGFNDMLTQIESRNMELMEAHRKLEERVDERTWQLQQEIIERQKAEEALRGSQEQLIDSAHKAGMADVATGILHNLGNVLNSVNVSTEVISNVVRTSKVESLINVNEILNEHMDRIGEFLTTDPKGMKLPEFYLKIGAVLREENDIVRKETERIEDKIATMRGIVETQQEYARAEFHSEKEELPNIIRDVLKIQKVLIESNGVQVTGDYEKPLSCRVHKYKLIHVLLNLVKNAVESMKENDLHNKSRELTIETGHIDDKNDFISVMDNGCGIPSENLLKIFNHGFTTKEGGHGFGLHASANSMTEMGGGITAESDGENRGAVFTLKLPA
jgi:signal transduction histidine kinase